MDSYDLKQALENFDNKTSSGEPAGTVAGIISAKTVNVMVEKITHEVSQIVAEVSVAKGMEIEKKSNAINLLNYGVDMQIISKALGLSIEELEALKKQPQL